MQEYTDNKIDGKVRISPSSMYNLYDNPAKWYKNNVLGIKDSSNNNIIVGNIIHDRIYRFYQGLEPDYDGESIYLDKFKNSPEINDWEITDSVTEIYAYLIKDYIPTTVKPIKMEEYIEYIPKTNPDVFIGGTFDYLYKKDGKTILGDYKTCGSIPTSMKTNHWLQLLIYAWLLKFNDIKVDKIEITYIRRYDKGTISEKTGKRIGVKLPEAQIIQQDLNDEDLIFIQKELVNIGRRISLCKQDETMVELVFPTNYLSHF